MVTDLARSATPAAGTLADAKRQATVDQILVATMQLVMDRGLDITMDEIAEAVGVGRRTLFRHFDTRENLLAQAVEGGVQRYGEHLPPFEGEWRTWLRALCDAAHRMQSAYGPGYWELTSRSDLAADIAAVEERRRTRRKTMMTRVANKLWREAGGSDAAPDHVRASVGAHLSARFTAAVTVDAGESWQVAADLAFAAISAAIESALTGR